MCALQIFLFGTTTREGCMSWFAPPPPPFYRVPHSPPFFIPRQKGDNQFQTQQQTYQSTQPNTLPVFFCSIGYGKNSLAKSFKPINWPPPPPLPLPQAQILRSLVVPFSKSWPGIQRRSRHKRRGTTLAVLLINALTQ